MPLIFIVGVGDTVEQCQPDLAPPTLNGPLEVLQHLPPLAIFVLPPCLYMPPPIIFVMPPFL